MPVALGAEGEDGARPAAGRAQLLPLGVDRQQRPIALRQRLDRGDGQREVQPGGAADGVGVPGVVLAGGEHRGRLGRRRDADAGADVAHVARVLEQDDRAPVAGSASAAARSTGGRRAIAATPVRGDQRHQPGERLARRPARPAPASCPARSGASRRPAPPARPGRPRPPRPARRRSAARA